MVHRLKAQIQEEHSLNKSFFPRDIIAAASVKRTERRRGATLGGEKGHAHSCRSEVQFLITVIDPQKAP